MSQHRSAEPEAPALEVFLQPARPPRRLLGPELAARLAVHFTEPPTRPQESALPLRIMVMWRLIRTTALTKGLCAEDESLDEATEIQPDPWYNPFKPILAPATMAALRRGRANRLLRIHAEADGLPLLPPRDDPEALVRWCDAASLIATDLNIPGTQAGLLGLETLLDPVACAYCDVTPSQVMTFEDRMIDATLDLLRDAGENETIRHYRERYGLTHKECANLTRLAKAHALRRTSAGIEEKRAMLEMRLEQLRTEAREALNLSEELKILKELARVQGLTRTDPEDQAAEFLAVVKRVSREQDQKALPAGTMQRLTASRQEVVEAVVLESVEDDDAEALEEFDREN